MASGYSQDQRDAKYSYQQQKNSYKQSIGGSIAQDEWEAKLMRDKQAAAIAADQASYDYEEKNGATDKRHFPAQYLFTKICGLPPIGFEKNIKEPTALADDTLKTAQDTVFKNSFPILAIRPVDISRPNNTSNIGSISPLVSGGFYRFAIQNIGSTSYSITNQYGSSAVEGIFNKINEQADIFNQLNQISKTSRVFNQAFNVAKSMPGINDANNSIQTMKKELEKLLMPNGSNEVTDIMKSLGKTMLQSTIGGQKIDIPDIWNGSSGGATQSIRIILHCYDTSDDDDYRFTILDPLQVILALSAPYSTSTKNMGNSDSNDIVTYENPPYIEAYIDGMFQTKLGAITNCEIDIPYNRISYYKRRPYIVNVSLTIKDMYNCLLYNDGGTYAPNVLDIISNLESPEQLAVTSPNEPVSEVYSRNWLQEPNSTNVVSAIANAIASVGNAIGDIASTGGIVNNIAAAGANAISGIIKQVIPTSMSSIASNANELLNKTSNSLLKNAKKSMVNTVVSGVNKIKSFF